MTGTPAKRLLLTGATGFIGRHVMRVLLERHPRLQITATARSPRQASELPWPAPVDFVPYDYHRSTRPVEQVFGPQDVVVHLAWQGLPHYHRRHHVEDNAPASYRLLEALVETGARRLFVAGTCLEYGLREGELRENHPARPTTSYGRAKDLLRRRLQALLADRPGTSLCWGRIFYAHGPGQHRGSLLPLLDAALDAGAEAFDMSAGDQLRDYLPVEEVARHVVDLALNREATGVVNVCSGRPTSVRHLVEAHLRRRGASIRLELGRLPYAEHEPMAFWGDTTRLSAWVAGPGEADG